MLKQLKPALIIFGLLAVLTGLVYPGVITGLAQLIFPHQANGSLITQNGQVVGSELIGQPFSAPGYFHPRPSAAGDGYDAVSSGGSNLGPTSQKLIDAVKERIAVYRAENKLAPEVLIPADAVTASASGLDPHISVKNALLQASRVAGVRGVGEEALRKKILSHTEGRDLGIFGEPRVNVLMLNLDMDGKQ